VFRTSLSRATLTLASILALAASACTSDRIVAAPATLDKPSAPQDNLITARNAFQRYVAIGTSISAGVQSDGLVALTQATSWPAQLDAMVGRALSQPYISGTGCRSPLIAPLILATRLSGEGALTDPSLLGCSPLLAGLAPPFGNVSLNGALTSDALFTTPQNIADAGNAKIYGRVLEPGMTQVSSMLEQSPTLVSIELGSNEVLGVTSGVVIPNVTIVPFATWAPLYNAVLDKVKSVTNTAVAVGLIDDIADVQALRAGDDIWADRLEFALFNVTIAGDCKGSTSLIFVPLAIPLAVENGLAQAQQGTGRYTFSCTPGSPTTQDFILSPSEAALVNTQMHAMSAYIQLTAAQHGFAYFALGALYDAKNAKGAFSVVKLLTSPAPFGSYFSLDGLHPSAAGSAILARAAAQALNSTYGLGIPVL
jgi:lysophospholipase L1-like esterase